MKSIDGSVFFSTQDVRWYKENIFFMLFTYHQEIRGCSQLYGVHFLAMVVQCTRIQLGQGCFVNGFVVPRGVKNFANHVYFVLRRSVLVTIRPQFFLSHIYFVSTM